MEGSRTGLAIPPRCHCAMRLELRPSLHDDGSRGLVKYDLNQLGPTGFEGPHRPPSGSVSSLTSCSCGNVNQPKGEPPPETSHCTTAAARRTGDLLLSAHHTHASGARRAIPLTLRERRPAEPKICGLNVWTRIQPGIPRTLQFGVVGVSLETAGSALHPDAEAPPMSQCPAGLLRQVSCPSRGSPLSFA
jgi:hypothetical protein